MIKLPPQKVIESSVPTRLHAATMMPLAMANVGDVNIIRKITGRDEVRQRLAELGFVVGETVVVVSELGGNLILHVKESRVALDKTMAMRIMV